MRFNELSATNQAWFLFELQQANVRLDDYNPDVVEQLLDHAVDSYQALRDEQTTFIEEYGSEEGEELLPDITLSHHEAAWAARTLVAYGPEATNVPTWNSVPERIRTYIKNKMGDEFDYMTDAGRDFTIIDAAKNLGRTDAISYADIDAFLAEREGPIEVVEAVAMAEITIAGETMEIPITQ